MSQATPESMRELVTGYALGALSPEETRAFEAALSASPELQRELLEHRELNAVLALAQAEPPPPELKARLLTRIDQSKRVILSGGSPPSAAALPQARRSFTPIVMGAGLAAAVVLAIGQSLKVRTLNETIQAQDSVLADRTQLLARREETLNAILEPNVQLVTMVATGEAPPVAQVFFDPSRGRAIVHTFRLKPAPAGRAYQLWLLPKTGNPIASRVFNTEADGHGLEQAIPVTVSGDIAGFALTEEPAGGSPQPTTTPFLVGMLGVTR
jgi:anti-sigma-K factor RskA